MTNDNDSPKSLFLLEEGITYLNCANMSPMLKSVKQAGLEALENRATPWKISSADWFKHAEILRSLASQIFQTSSENIALIPSVSYGMAACAKNLKLQAGKGILVLEHQFPSNYYVWEKIAGENQMQMIIVRREKNKTLTESILEKINRDTGVIAIPNCHWIDGKRIDLEAISAAAKTVNSYLVLDLSQSLGALPINMDKIQPDFAVSVGYKWLLGPYGLGYMYVSKKWQDEGDPLEYSWLTRKGSEDFSSLTDYMDGYRDGARRFDMGEFPQFNLMPMAIAALKQVIEWDAVNIQPAIKKLTDPIVDYKKAAGVEDDLPGVGHIISIPCGNKNLETLKKRLQDKKVAISFRGTSIRVSPHLYNNSDDVEELLSCLQE